MAYENHNSNGNNDLTFKEQHNAIQNTTHIQKSKAQPTHHLSYEQRLLGLYINHVEKTAEVKHPQLVKWLEQVYEVDIAPDKAVLLPETVEQLKQQLEQAQTQVHQACQDISQYLKDLAVAIAQTPTNPITLELTRFISEASGQLEQAVKTLLDIGQDYVGYARQPKNDDPDVNNLNRDLYYLSLYIAKWAQVRTIQGEFLPNDDPQLYFRRLQGYLSLCPTISDQFGNEIANHLQNKVALGKFTPPPQNNLS